jgi:glycosyltransferase involved in cell wall biosynthesis
MPPDPKPKVSVAMITYNHEKFIAQAIESVLMQETSFPIDLVIGEDCSTDGTRQIVEHYARLRPDVVWPLLHERNVGMHANVQAVLATCRGEYIASLEGDDYWTSPRKLQTQAEFLDQHPDYSICGHRVMHVDQNRPEQPPYPSPVRKETGYLEDILRRNYLPTASVMYRAGLLTELPAWLLSLRQSDWPMWILLAQQGKIGFINEIMAVYRIHSGGVFMGASVEQRLKWARQATLTVHRQLGKRYPKVRRMRLFDLRMMAAESFNQAGRYRDATRHLFLAAMTNPIAFAKSPEARRDLGALVHVSLPARGGRAFAASLRHARMRVGAVRRHLRRAVAGGWSPTDRNG